MADQKTVGKTGNADVGGILKERGEKYGGDANLVLTAQGWDAYVKGLKGRALTAVDVCHMMAMLKSFRVSCGDPSHQDNHDDGAGYLTIAARLNKGIPR